jgi:ferredoxin-NADP reductase
MEDIEPGAVVIYRTLRHDDVVFRNELEPLARGRGIELRFIAGDHATEDGARLLTPTHLRELVPDIRERDVYVCGPPAMTDAIERNVRRTGVPSRHIHTERFAL